MRVQINLDSPFTFKRGRQVTPMNFCGDLILAVDPGKTNMAMVVGNTYGTKLCVLQFSAAGYANDNSEYCMDFKDFIQRFLSNCNIRIFGIEQAISKKGMNFHYTSMVLTEIRANLIDLAYDLTDRKAEEINNWSWKHSILPEGMRSQTEKGSTRFLSDVYAAYGNSDVTDAICMYKYLVHEQGDKTPMFPDKAEESLANHQIFILPAGNSASKGARVFKYNEALTLEQNCTYFSNRTWEKGVSIVKADLLTLEEIYKHASRFHAINRDAEVVVVRS